MECNLTEVHQAPAMDFNQHILTWSESWANTSLNPSLNHWGSKGGMETMIGERVVRTFLWSVADKSWQYDSSWEHAEQHFGKTWTSWEANDRVLKQPWAVRIAYTRTPKRDKQTLKMNGITHILQDGGTGNTTPRQTIARRSKSLENEIVSNHITLKTRFS